MSIWERARHESSQKSVYAYNSLPFDREISKTKFGNISSITRRFILKDRGLRTRILYAGPHPTNTEVIAYYKIVEMFAGKYYLEENLINPFSKSIQSRLVSLEYDIFHKFVKPETENHYRRHYPKSAHVVCHSYIRSLTNKKRVFQNIFVEDINHYNFLKYPFAYMREWKLKFYFLSK